ncbi:unnamed protein product [Cuscuta epithymum]|uniref:Uncharacterized protein n=1 Tax=Cuscuta epithymum TaxID=186058 RepID=A0AAV0DGE5_9ASTE|nr:unnamed protein product [Cuscuta epithymum]
MVLSAAADAAAPVVQSVLHRRRLPRAALTVTAVPGLPVDRHHVPLQRPQRVQVRGFPLPDQVQEPRTDPVDAKPPEVQPKTSATNFKGSAGGGFVTCSPFVTVVREIHFLFGSV